METEGASAVGRLFVGCPIWACDAWRGQVFTSQAPRAQWLKQYSQAFDTVEGNSTFYALPSLETAARWAESTETGFRFALKVSRAITHDCRLVGAERDMEDFLAVARVLDAAGRLGPSFLQMPPDFSPRFARDLEKFLRDLPGDLPWALELRHLAWFDNDVHEKSIDQLLAELNIDKVIFDSRPLYAKPPSDDVERAAQGRKPKTPVRQTVTAHHPFLRLIGRNNLEDVKDAIAHWAPVIAAWVREGRHPFVFTHAPDDRFAPPFARALYQAVATLVPELPPARSWPGENSGPSTVQLSLF